MNDKTVQLASLYAIADLNTLLSADIDNSAQLLKAAQERFRRSGNQADLRATLYYSRRMDLAADLLSKLLDS